VWWPDFGPYPTRLLGLDPFDRSLSSAGTMKRRKITGDRPVCQTLPEIVRLGRNAE
jgi:hypothetical protein